MKEVLQRIVKNPSQEARWLNTLSLLEHIGAQKVSKTVCGAHPPIEILQHHADGAYRAYTLKWLSSLLSKGKCRDYLCLDEGISYFQMLDQTITEWLSGLTNREETYQNYLFVTCLLERRAKKLYSLYKQVARHPAVQEELKSIVLDRTKHLKEIEARAKGVLSEVGKNGFSHCLKIEEDLFSVFENSLRKKLKLAA